MITQIILFFNSIDIDCVVILNESLDIVYKSSSFPQKILNVNFNKSSEFPFYHSIEIDNSHFVLLKLPQNFIIILYFDTYSEYKIFINRIFEKVINNLLGNVYKKNPVLSNLPIFDLRDKFYYEEKRQLELFFSHAVRSCNFTQVDALIPKLFSYSFTKDLVKDYDFVKKSVISLIAILTRIAISENVDPHLAYDLSDFYLKTDFSVLKNNPHAFIKKITFDFIHLLENHRYKFDFPIVDKTIASIRRNIYAKIVVSNIAKEHNVTVQYLSSVFKKKTGISIKHFIQKEKMKEAKFLLINTDLSINQISLDLGYSSQSLFSKNFKEQYNITPNNFRQKNIY